MSEVGVAALCGCVSCGLWVPLMWSVCGRELPWALQFLVGVYWRLRECVCLVSEVAWQLSVGVSLVCGCGRELSRALQPLVGVYRRLV